MKKIALVGLLVLVAFCSSVLAADVNLPEAVDKATQSRVLILVYDKNNELTAFGSGFVVRPDHVITAAHLFFQGKSFLNFSSDEILDEVTIKVGEDNVKAKIIKVWLQNDLALLRIGEPIGSPVVFANTLPENGEVIYASGFSFKGDFKTTLPAIILGKIDSVSYDGIYVIDYVNVIDRLLPKGFSGGPAFNGKGELIGMNLCATTDGISGLLTFYPIRYLLKDIK